MLTAVVVVVVVAAAVVSVVVPSRKASRLRYASVAGTCKQIKHKIHLPAAIT